MQSLGIRISVGMRTLGLRVSAIGLKGHVSCLPGPPFKR